MHLNISSDIAHHPFTIHTNQALCRVVDTMWDQIKFVMEEGVLKKSLQALNWVMVKQPHQRFGGYCCFHDTVLPLGITGEELD